MMHTLGRYSGFGEDDTTPKITFGCLNHLDLAKLSVVNIVHNGPEHSSSYAATRLSRS